jgi:hypothetical protein
MKITIKVRKSLAYVVAMMASSFIFCAALVPTGAADHIAKQILARGSPDTVLCGIDVYHCTVSQAISKLGEPHTAIKLPNTPPGLGGGQYEWEKNGVRVRITAWRHAMNSMVYSVEAWGTRSKGNLGRTGRGLALGESLQEVRSIFGGHFWVNSRYSGGEPRSLLIQWQDGTTITVSFDRLGKIDYIYLLASVE